MEAIVESRSTREAGFSLVELMVTLTVAGILLAIAVPSYNSQIRKSRRTDAKTALLDLATREERFLSLNNAYTNDSTSLGYGAGGFPQTVGSNYYQIGAPAITAAQAGVAAAFTATVTPLGPQVNDTQCASLSIDSTGRQSALDVNGADATVTCWN